MKLKTLEKKIRRLETRLLEGPKKLAKLKGKLGLSQSQRRKGEEEIDGSRCCRWQKKAQLNSKIAGKTGRHTRIRPQEGEEETQSLARAS